MEARSAPLTRRTLMITQSITVAPTARPDTRRSPLWLWPARALWVLVFVALVAIFARSAYDIFIIERYPCSINHCSDFDIALIKLGLSIESFTAYFLALRILTAVAYFSLAI